MTVAKNNNNNTYFYVLIVQCIICYTLFSYNLQRHSFSDYIHYDDGTGSTRRRTMSMMPDLFVANHEGGVPIENLLLQGKPFFRGSSTSGATVVGDINAASNIQSLLTASSHGFDGEGNDSPPADGNVVVDKAENIDPLYKLAYEQSYGFFDDITNEQWMRAQTIHSRMFPNHQNNLYKHSSVMDDKGVVENLRNRGSKWYGDNFQEEFHCNLAQRIQISGEADGPKWVCDPHRITKQVERRIVENKNKRVAGNKDGKDTGCLIYSVGSNGKVEFEQGIKEEIHQDCEIHTFDLVHHNKRNGMFEVALNGINATFHHWGFGTQQQSLDSKKRGKGYQFKTLKQTMIELGHENRTIDIFKIDCEWCEWSTFPQWIGLGDDDDSAVSDVDIANMVNTKDLFDTMQKKKDKNDFNIDIRQILIETHNSPMPNIRNLFYALHDYGYVIFNKEANYLNQAECVEYGFLKLSPDFFINNSTYASM